MEEIKSIRISELKDFKNHPFHVQQDIELCAHKAFGVDTQATWVIMILF